MNGTTPRIQIIAPFTAAFDWTKMVLFSPFDIVKWLTIAFTAFLAGHWGGNFKIGRSWNFPDFNYSFRKDGNLPGNWDWAPWLIALVAAGALVVVVLALVWMWVSSRGRFMFTDCVVKNRAAIAEPWREYRREGNSYFLFSLVIGFCTVVVLVIVGLLLWLLFGGMRESGAGAAIFFVALAVFGLIWLVLALFFGLVFNFMVPVMYRRRCSAREAFVDVAKLIFANPGPFLLFALFCIALFIAIAVIGTVVACLTCCIGALPYVSTVILLPAIVWLAAYRLLFLRQFGDAYDVWATIVAPVQTIEPLPPPPAPPVA